MFPLFFDMENVIEKVHTLLEPLLDNTDMFIINIKVKPINNIKVYLDSDSGLSIDKCVQINRRLHALMEEEQMFPEGDYSLEVSSPGIDEPLTQHRQYKKNVGRKVLVTPNEGDDKEGILKEVTDEELVLEMKVPKKKETQMVTIPFADIKKTVVQIIF